MFKVVPDQLRISDGWVRCGQCDEVFDANANLHSESEVFAHEALREPVATTSPDPDWAASLRFASDDSPEVVGRTSTDAAPRQPQPEIMAEERERDGDEALLPPTRESQLEPLEPALDDFLSQSPMVLAQSALTDRERHSLDDAESPLEPLAGPAPRYTQTHVEVVASDAPKQPSFMRNSRTTSSAWNVLGVRIVLGFLGCLLTVSLGLQVALQERDRWAAYEPASVPALKALCEVVGCSLSPLRYIDALVIDSSSFIKVRSDMYRLNVAFKNIGSVPVAPPALELTLTDMQDQSLIRRVLKPQDIEFNEASLQPGAEFSAVLPIYVKTGSAAERVSGYRLIAFYP